MAHFKPYDKNHRAQKRIQGEDVFGQKIKVLAPSTRSYTGQKLNIAEKQQLSGLTAPPPGFGYEKLQKSDSYLYNLDSRRKDNRSGFRPITKLSSPCISPMEMSFEQYQGNFSRRTPSSRQGTPQEQLMAAFNQEISTRTSGSSELSDGSDIKGVFNEKPQPVQLKITNLDPTIDSKELRRLLANMIKEYAMVLNLEILIQPDGSPVASLTVSSQQEAQFVISQLHRQKLGHKRIMIACKQNNAPDPEQLKLMIVGILQDTPNKKMPLFKFMELLETRYLCSVAVSEVNKLREVAKIVDERGSRVIALNEEAAMRISPADNLKQDMLHYCVIHSPNNMQNWWELNSSVVPNVMISLSIFTANLITLLDVHFGSLPLLSFQHCFEQVFHEPLPVSEQGVPLEHLVTCIPNVEIKLIGPNKNIKVIQRERKSGDTSNEEHFLKTLAPALAQNMNLLCREVVDLMKNVDKCQILLTKFIPAYHHYFRRQCRVADYGYTKLIDLLEAIPHVVQIMGDGHRKVITLTHAAQIRRFTSDLLRILKVQTNKQIFIHEFSSVYEKTLGKHFNPVEYGLCTLDDLLCEIPENTVVISKEDEGLCLSLPKREQTPEEVLRTKQFANEVVDLLRHNPYFTMLFNKFVPSYHHHFGHQCKVSDYGFTKLIELFEAIPDVVEIKEQPDGERAISLTPQLSLKILSSQISELIRLQNSQMNLDDLPLLYYHKYGYPLHPQMYHCESLDEVVERLSEYLDVIHSNAGTLLRIVEMDTSPNILRVRCWILLLCPPHVKELATFKNDYRSSYRTGFNVEALGNISNVVNLSSMNNVDYISLTSTFVLAAQLYYVICNQGGSVEYSQLERLYEEAYNKPLKFSSFNINSANEFYTRFGLLFFIKRVNKKRVVVLNWNLQEHISQNNNREMLANPENQSLLSLLDAEEGAVKKYSAPKPDTPPTPGSTLWWNTPAKSSNMNISIKLPLSSETSAFNLSDHLSSPVRNLLAVGNPWHILEEQALAPEPHELPIPSKLLSKNATSDDSGDSGVNILLDNSPPETDFSMPMSESTGAIKKQFCGTFLNFK